VIAQRAEVQPTIRVQEKVQQRPKCSTADELAESAQGHLLWDRTQIWFIILDAQSAKRLTPPRDSINLPHHQSLPHPLPASP
jgi:hypothetical protein